MVSYRQTLFVGAAEGPDSWSGRGKRGTAVRQAQHDGVPAGPLTGVRMLDRSRLVTGDMSMQGVAERLFRAIGRPELIDAPRFATNEARARHDDLLDPPHRRVR